MLEKIAIALLSSEVVQTAIIGIIAAWVAKWFASENGLKWKKYEGWAITAIKAAEKAIPDDAKEKGWKRMDKALQEFCAKYEKTTGVAPGEKELVAIENLIAEVHAKLEKNGNL